MMLSTAKFARCLCPSKVLMICFGCPKSPHAQGSPKARFRLVLVFCLPQVHVNPLNEFLIDLATELWIIIISFSVIRVVRCL